MLIITQQIRAFSTVAGGFTQAVDTINVPAGDSIVNDDLGLDNVIDYFGKDSTVVDVVNQRIYLYGDAWVTYGDMRVQAEYIDFSFNEFTARASGKRDSTGTVITKAIFKEGDKEFEEDSLAYNFKTKKGISYGVRTKEDQLYLLSEVSKKATNNWISIGNGQLTTCDHPNPHFHFRLKRAMVIPNEKVVSGPVVLKFRKVPLFALPFGFFPNKKESTHGILLPGYGNANQKGYFLQNLGYYIPINDKLDTKITFDVYTRGSWAVRNHYNYKQNYKYSGSFDASFQKNKTGLPELQGYSEEQAFRIQWSHAQDQRARPNTRFGASVDLGSINNTRQNINVSQSDYLSNTFNSNISWNKSWPDRPFNIGVVAKHSQNTQSGNVDVTLPEFTGNMQRITLGRFAKNKPALKSFLDNFGLDASVNANNRVSGKSSLYRWDKADSLLLQSRNGLRTGANMSASVRAKQYGTLNFSLRGETFHAFRYLQQQFDEVSQQFNRDTLYGFKSALNWGTSAGFNQRLYGTFSFRNSERLKAIRHVFNWRAGMSYTPFSNYEIPYYSSAGVVSSYSIFDLASVSPGSSGEALSANFSIQQNWEAKVKDRTSAKLAYKKIKLIDSWTTSFSRNFLADSLNWSNVTMSAFTTLAKDFQINYNNAFSVYDRDSLGREVNVFLLDSKSKLMRVRSQSLAVNFKFKSKNKKPVDRADQQLTEEEQNLLDQNQQNLIDFSVPWTLGVNYILRLDRGFDKVSQSDTLDINNKITFNGDITFLKRYAVSVNSGYDMSNPRYTKLQFKDFGLRDFSTTTISFHVDLHCWEFSFNYIPFGLRQSYTAQLNIKSPLLKDLKLQRRGSFGEGNSVLW
ncbi:MAG: putative LPS assembly protein LptD [Flavobacteriales bacterium]